MKKRIEFTHVYLGKEKDVCIAHIYKQDDPWTIHEYAVVRYPDLDENSEYYGTWGWSLGYFPKYEEAVEKFNEYMGNI